MVFDKNKSILVPRGMTIFNYSQMKDEDVLNRAAFILRKHILDLKVQKVGTNIHAEDLMRGECELPET